MIIKYFDIKVIMGILQGRMQNLKGLQGDPVSALLWPLALAARASIPVSVSRASDRQTREALHGGERTQNTAQQGHPGDPRIELCLGSTCTWGGHVSSDALRPGSLRKHPKAPEKEQTGDASSNNNQPKHTKRIGIVYCHTSSLG